VKTCKLALCSLAILVVAFVLNGCGGNKEATEESTPAPAANASPGKPVDEATVAEVTGTVKLEGTPPEMRRINMAAEPNCARANSGPVFTDQVVTGEGGALANVVVYVKSVEGYSFPKPSTDVEIDQKGCMYQPHVVALEVGQKLRVVNSDRTTHNIHPIPKYNREWNESQPPNAAPFEKTFAHPEVAIPVKCNVHPWMKAYIAVMQSPYFQVTGKDGAFDLKNLPPGTYTLVAWHELYGTSQQTITVGPKETRNVTFTFKANGAAAD
jgi:plastocyanin